MRRLATSRFALLASTLACGLFVAACSDDSGRADRGTGAADAGSDTASPDTSADASDAGQPETSAEVT